MAPLSPSEREDADMAAVTVILRDGDQIIDTQVVDEELVPAILDHMAQHPEMSVHVVPAGFSRVLGVVR
jgi:hypothetical protein